MLCTLNLWSDICQFLSKTGKKNLLGWPKSSFWFFHYILWANLNNFLAKPIPVTSVLLGKNGAHQKQTGLKSLLKYYLCKRLHEN